MYIFTRNRKNVLRNEIKDLTFEVSNPSLSFFKLFPRRDQTFITSAQKGGKEVWKFVACLRILLFLSNRSIDLLFIFANVRGRGGGQKISHFLWMS